MSHQISVYSPSLSSSCVVISGPGEGSTKFGNLSGSFVDRDDVTSLNLFLDYGLDHFCTLARNEKR
jgi:hypothetical protein